MKCRDIRLHEEKYRKENTELEFKLRGAQTKEQYEYQQAAEYTEYSDNRQRIVADTDRFERESGGTVGEYSRQRYDNEFIAMDSQTNRKRNSKSNEFIENGDNGFTETGWESEREYLFSGKAIEEDGQSM